MDIVATFDLTNEDQYAEAYAVLEEFGLSQYTPEKNVKLPSTTVLGRNNDYADTADLAEAIRDRMRAKPPPPKNHRAPLLWFPHPQPFTCSPQLPFGRDYLSSGPCSATVRNRSKHRTRLVSRKFWKV